MLAITDDFLIAKLETAYFFQWGKKTPTACFQSDTTMKREAFLPVPKRKRKYLKKKYLAFTATLFLSPFFLPSSQMKIT